MKNVVRNQANGVAAMGIIVLMIGGCSAALAGYTFFVALPPTMSGITNASNDVRNLANAVTNLANSVPCGNGCDVLGYRVLDLSSVKNYIQGFATPMYNISETLTSFRDTLYMGILTMLGLGIAMVFAGVGLMVTAAAIRNISRLNVTV